MLKYAHQIKKNQLGEQEICGAISGGHLECLKYIKEHENYLKPYPTHIINDAGSNMECLLYLIKCGYKISKYSQCIYNAVKAEDLLVLQYLHRQIGCFLNYYLMELSIQKGNIPILKYLLEIKCPIDPNAYYNILNAPKNNLAMCKLLSYYPTNKLKIYKPDNKANNGQYYNPNEFKFKITSNIKPEIQQCLDFLISKNLVDIK